MHEYTSYESYVELLYSIVLSAINKYTWFMLQEKVSRQLTSHFRIPESYQGKRYTKPRTN